ncbi:MAG: hypothetical protein AB1898_21075 [Acidobacteriota bacterium]
MTERDPRRAFMRKAASGVAWSWFLKRQRALADGTDEIPSAGEPIPNVTTLCSVVMPHRFGDLFNPPGLTNFWGCAQAALDVTGIRSVSFPPFAQGEQNIAPLGANGEVITAVLFLDGEYDAARKPLIEFVWQPDRIQRRSTYKSFQLTSTTIVPFERQAVLVSLTVKNTSPQRRRLELKLGLNGGVTQSVKPWDQAYSPGELDNEREVDSQRGAVSFRSRHRQAYAIQGAWPRADAVSPAWLLFQLDLGPGEQRTITFANVLGSSREGVIADYDRLVQNFENEAERVRNRWNEELKAVFTPDNERFSGHLPLLVTADPSVRRLYHQSAMSALFFRRTTPHSTYGTTYVTLAPRYWQTTTFLWDISLSSMLLAMLDPAVLRRMMETWMRLDIHKHFGTEYLTGAGVGPWYSVNDFAMCRMAREYLRWTGDHAWLDRLVDGRSVMDRLVRYATHWRELDTNGHGLADYGGVHNLLEAVGSYVHEVASLNAANVFNLRFVAELLEHRGQSEPARTMRAEAASLVHKVKGLYAPGKGFWRCRLPDGSLQEVRHCYDFGTVLSTIANDLDAAQKKEMVQFFQSELQTEKWMRALSIRDMDVTFTIRPDHQWTGAYCAWPALALEALYSAGASDQAFEWMKGLAQTAGQGPLAQAHFAEDFVPAEAGGGARKVPSDQPYINDWACVSGMAYLEPVVQSLFGIQAGLFGEITARPNFSSFDPKAELRNLRYQGRDYVASASGVKSVG